MEYGPVDFVKDIKVICEYNNDRCEYCPKDIRDICQAGYGKDALIHITPVAVKMVRGIVAAVQDDGVEHGQAFWRPDIYYPEDKFWCSNCNWTGEFPHKYCPCCGSKMDGVKSDG